MALLSCRSNHTDARPSSRETSSTEDARPAVDRVFRGRPLELTELVVRPGEDIAPREVQVRAKAETRGGGRGRVTLPLEISCRFGEHRVAIFSEMITASGASFSLDREKVVEGYSHAPTTMGWLGDPDACELTFKLAPNTGAKEQGVEAETEQVCWTGSKIVAGPCGFGAPSTPSEPFRVHHLTARADRGLDVHAHLQTRDANPHRYGVTLEATCGDEPVAREFDMLPEVRPFTLQAGESVPLSFTLFRGRDIEADHCTIRLIGSEWRTSDEMKPSAPAPLGTYCVPRDTGAGREPPAVTEGPCP